MRFAPALLGFTEGDVWRPQIGDPTVMGWLTVFAYFGVAALCFRRARKASGSPQTRGACSFWGGLTAVLVLLGINKQLDFQTLLTLTARKIAIAQGWYEDRRPIQLIFVVLVGLAAVAGFAFLWRLVRTQSGELWISLLGLVLLLAFVIVRAASFHHVDTLINFRPGGIRINWVLELGAIGIIGLGTRPKQGAKTLGIRNLDSKASLS